MSWLMFLKLSWSMFLKMVMSLRHCRFVVMSLRHCRFVVMCHVAVIASVVNLGLSQG